MRLPIRAPRRATLAVAPFADLALLLVVLVAVAAMSSTVRGLGLRFVGSPASVAAEVSPRAAVIVAVSFDGRLRVDGAEVARESLVRTVRERLAIAPGATVLLVVDPSATYQAAIDAAAPLLDAKALGGRPLSIPTGRQVEELLARSGTPSAGGLP